MHAQEFLDCMVSVAMYAYIQKKRKKSEIREKKNSHFHCFYCISPSCGKKTNFLFLFVDDFNEIHLFEGPERIIAHFANIQQFLYFLLLSIKMYASVCCHILLVSDTA